MTVFYKLISSINIKLVKMYIGQIEELCTRFYEFYYLLYSILYFLINYIL